MEREFDRELKDLNLLIIRMSTLAEESIARSMQALKETDRSIALDVIEKDRDIDELELTIEEACIRMLALHQPAAADLRFIATGMKLNVELERIADLAVDISQRVLEIIGQPVLKPLVLIPHLAVIAQAMVRDAITAFVNRDIGLARKVLLSDGQADDLRDTVQTELIHNYMEKDSSTVSRAVPLLLVARHLERMCDHATNIAEDVIYMVEAKVVKHTIGELDIGGSQQT
jgi:phosphate transport system protein